MTTYAWPTANVFQPQTFEWRGIDRTRFSESGYTGAIQTGEIPFSYRYGVTISWPGTNDFTVQQQRVAFLMKIRRSHRVNIHNFAHPVPRGTMRGTPTVTNTLSQGGTAITITTSTSNEYLREGDLIGVTTAIGTQVLTIVADAGGSGATIAANFEPPLRAQVTSGSAVVWNKPAPLFVQKDNEWAAGYRPREGTPITVSFTEVW